MVQLHAKETKLPQLRHQLLAWYESNQRDLPWRRTGHPYAIWISEIMLQQTRVAAVVEKYRNFLVHFPSVEALAKASEQDVLALWSGLGYYRRARMLHKAAQMIMKEYKGRMPATAAELRKLPGIGSYTAAAIASIVHNEAVAVIDGNVERVVCRMMGWDADQHTDAALRKKIEVAASEFLDPAHPGNFNQAMMELGAMVCTPRSPQCMNCPWVNDCKTCGEHKTRKRPAMKNREVTHALCVRKGRGVAGGQVLLEQRAASLSVMPGLWELPALHDATMPEEKLCLTVRHAIMQVNYIVHIYDLTEKELAQIAPKTGKHEWVSLHDAAKMALTGLARKVLSRSRLLPDVAR